MLGVLFIGRLGYGQVVTIEHPSNVCKNNSANLTIHSDQEITFYIEESTDGGGSWAFFGGRQRTVSNGTDFTYTTGSLITVSSKYRVWYSTNQNFQSSASSSYITNRSPEITIDLFPTPVVNSLTANPVCSGNLIQITPVADDGAGNNVPSTFTWTTPSLTQYLSGGASTNVASSSISGTLTSISSSVQTATYTVTPRSVLGGCLGNPFTLTIPIKPTPSINSQTTAICSGEAFNVSPIDVTDGIVPSGTTYSWLTPTYTAGTITGAASGSGNSIGGTLTNTTRSIQYVTYIVTANSGTCTSSTFTVTVAVKPRPNIANNPYIPQICNGTPFVFTPLSSDIVPTYGAGTKYTWTVGANSNVDESDVVTPTSSFSQTLNNIGGGTERLNYVVTPTSDGCVGPSFTASVDIIPSPVINSGLNTSICSGGNLSFRPENGNHGIVPANTNYTWTIAANANVTGQDQESIERNRISDNGITIINRTDANEVLYYNVTTHTVGCTSTTFTLTVNIAPNASISPKNIDIISGTNTSVLPGSSYGDIVLTGTNYIWSITPNSNIDGFSATNTPTISIDQTLTNRTNQYQTAVYNVSSVSTTCESTSFLVTAIVVPKPIVLPKPSNIVNSGDPFSVTINDNSPTEIVPLNTSYSWSLPFVTNTMTGVASATNATAVSGTLTNLTSSTQTATYTVTPSIFAPRIGTVNGQPFSVTVTVNPRPKIGPKFATICSGGNFSVTITDNAPSEIVPANTTYTWSAPTLPTGLIGAVGATNAGTISGTLINQTAGTLTATYTVTPWSGSAAGDEFTVTVTVNPKATIQANIAAPVCTGTAFTFTPNLNDVIPTGTTYSWNLPSVTGGMTGGATATNAGTISGTLTNATNAPQTALYSITTSSGNCAGATFTMSVTVNPRPQILSKATVVNSGGTFSITIVDNRPSEIVPINTNYSWDLPTITASLEGAVIASGAGSISGTLTNISSAVQTATYSVTPSFNSCVGSPFAFTVTVNPRPKILSNIHDLIICSGGTFSATIIDNSPTEIVPSNTTYTWSTPTLPTGLIGAVGATNTGTISGTLINQTAGMLAITYTITPKSGTAEGDPFTITVTVNPKATIASNTAAAVCSGFPFSFIPPNTDIVPLGTTYTWSNPSVTGGMTGGTSASNSATISGTLTNILSATQTATYLITPLSGSCPGGNFTITVNINALPYSPTTVPVIVTYNKLFHAFNVTTTPSNASNEILRWYSSPGVFSTSSPTYNLASPTPYTVLVSSYNNLTQCESAQKATASLTINTKQIDAQASAVDKVYDRTTTATASVTSNELESGDLVNFAHGGANFDTYLVGTGKTVTLTGVTINGGANASNYTLKSSSNTLTTTASITSKPITVTATATDRVYNATTSATVTLSSPGVIVPDLVEFNYTQALFNNKTANVGKPVSVSGITISGGADAGNYTLTATTATTTGTISKSEITITGAVASNKVYNGTISATITGGTLTPSVFLSDVVTLDLKGVFDNRNVGENKPVTSTSTIGGADKDNYFLTQPTGLTATISKKYIVEVNPVTQNKTYDATVKALNYTAALKTKQSVIGSDTDSTAYTIDDVSIVPTAEFATMNVGNSISISSTSTLAGADKGNYELVRSTLLFPRNISKKTLNMSGLIIPASKVYDGTRNAEISGEKSLLTASLPGEGTATDGKPYTIDNQLTFAGNVVGTYNTKDVLTANTVTFSNILLTGAGSGNYSLTIQQPTPATITPKELTMSGLSVPATKIYDANKNAVVTDNKTLQTKIAPGTGNKDDGKPYDPDVVSISGTAVGTYNSKDVVDAIRVDFTGLSLTGADASNYTLKIQAPSNSAIEPLIRNIVANQQNKIYGQDDPILTYTSDPLLESDTYTGELKRVIGKNVGSYPIEIGTLTAGSNYILNFTPNVLLIDKAIMFITAKNATRTYGDAPLETNANSIDFVADGMKYNETVGFVTVSYANGPGSGNAINDSVGTYAGAVNAVDVTGGTFNVMNYKTIFFRGDIIVKKLPIIVSAESKEKREGQQDPTLTYKISTPLVLDDQFTGKIIREPGEVIGAYQIQIGTLALSNNYDLTFRPAVFTINPEDPTFVLPTAFTPNGDGVNDVFKIIQDGISSINYFQIFSRSGRLVFQTKNLGEGWDGRVNGIVLDSDVYYWNVEFVTWNNKVRKVSGSVILIK